MKKVLIVHGPNMNFIGLKSAKDGSRITIIEIIIQLETDPAFDISSAYY